MINKEQIRTIVNNITINGNKKKLIFVSDHKGNLEIFTKNKNFTLILYKKNFFKNFLKFYLHFLYSGINIKKNFYLLFNVEKNLLIGHNFLPDWPGLYTRNSFFYNIFKWIKKFVYIFIFKKKLVIILIETI